MRTAIVVLILGLGACAQNSEGPHAKDFSDAEPSFQRRSLHVQDPSIIDLSSEAVERARQIVMKEETGGTSHGFECVHDFWSPFALEGFVPKNGRVFVVRVSGYDTKDAEGVINRFLWINEHGQGVWEP